MHVVTTISRMANFASITNSIVVARIIALTKPYLLDTTFLPIKYIKNVQSVPYKATGNLALNSFTCPNSANDRHSPQKYNGGFSKKYSPFKYKVKKSFVLNISLAIET